MSAGRLSALLVGCLGCAASGLGCAAVPAHGGDASAAGAFDLAGPAVGGNGGVDGGAIGGGDGGSHGAGQWISGTYTSAQGQRDYKAYIPSSYGAGTPLPLVVVLHGCTVGADEMDAITRFSTLAEARGFMVAYPIQSSQANAALCWNWFDAGSQKRGAGEASIIAGITTTLAGRYSVDGKRVFVTGGSAGGAMSVVMGATYPDLYAAVGVVAGCEYGGEPCGSSGGPSPTAQGHAAYQAMGSFARAVPVIVFQGDADSVVAPLNGQQVTQQWLATDDWADDGAADGSVPSAAAGTMTLQVPGGRSYARSVYDDKGGAPLLEYFSIHGAGHAWPGGAAGMTFSDPGGPDATALTYDFFLAHAHP